MAIDFVVDDDGIALITINRPERLNALDWDHYEALSKAWIRVRDDKEITCAIVTGAGEKSFTVGADIKEVLTDPTSLAEMWLTQTDQLLNNGLEVWKPIVAAVNGYCLGGGMTLLFATDIRVASRTASFSLAEVKRGIVPGNGGTQRILSQVPHAIAMEWLLTGDRFAAEEAARWGLVNAVVPPEDLMETAYAYARRVVVNAPLAVQAAKELAIRSRELGLTMGIRLETIASRLLSYSHDAEEGPAAFAEKRSPKWKGE